MGCRQLNGTAAFHDLPWAHIPGLLTTITTNHRTLDQATVIDCIIKDSRVAAQNLAADPAAWPESAILRQVMGDLAHDRQWIKSIGYAAHAFQFALPLLPGTSVIKVPA